MAIKMLNVIHNKCSSTILVMQCLDLCYALTINKVCIPLTLVVHPYAMNAVQPYCILTKYNYQSNAMLGTIVA